MIKTKECSGYTYTVLESGEKVAIDNNTGQVLPVITRDFPLGSITYTPQQQKSYKEQNDEESNHYFERRLKEKKKDYYFVSREDEIVDLSPETAARLIYLNSYIDVGHNKLMLSQRTPMRRKDLSRVLNISPATASRFWDEVYPNYIVEKNDGLMFTNSQFFIRGRLQNKSALKFFVESVRTLYESLPTNKHRYLGYVFRLLPFVNIEFNVLCFNPFEKELEKVEMMTLSDLCEYINFDKSNLHRLTNIYKSLRFKINSKSHTERFVSFIFDGTDRSQSKVYINPNILYSGSCFERVEILGAFCK